MRPDLRARLLDAATSMRLEAIASVGDHVVSDPADPVAVRALATADVLLTGWGSPRVDAALLDGAPHLRAVVHAAGSVRHHVDPVCWERGLVVSTAAGANARPVAEFTVAAVVFARKRVWTMARKFAGERHAQDVAALKDLGTYGCVVGVVGASRIGRLVIELLQSYDVDVVVTDPYLAVEEAAVLGARLVDLDELCSTSDVVTLHAPDLPETHHLVDARRLALMRDGATLVNTARGALVDTDALEREVLSGRLHAVLDVTDPEPLPSSSPLWEAPTALVTPHLAGSLGNELARLGAHAVSEVERFAAGEPFATPVTLADLARMA
jgi:phosphoglycerate dehydrogenase-like enzyme